MRWVKVRLVVPAPPPGPALEPVVQTKPAQQNAYAETIRLTSTTKTLQQLEWRSGFRGTLVGVTVFNDKVDPGDYWTLTLEGRTIREKALPVANTALKEDCSYPIDPGTSLKLNYYSQGTTLKNIDLTPRVTYLGEGL